MPYLRFLSGASQGQIFNLVNSQTTIGRETDCDIALAEDSSASGQHAVIYWSGEGWFVRDLGSSNGTQVNSVAVEEQSLTEGDVISVGNSSFVLEETPKDSVVAKDSIPTEAVSDSPDQGVVPQSIPKRHSSPATAPAELTDSAILKRVREMSNRTRLTQAEISKAIIGQTDIITELLTAIISRGHVLMIGMPGLAKTMMVRTVSEVLDLKFRRIQFTPDLMPTDITGTDILEVDESTGRKEYRFIKGPIFTNILLADEINRTPPKTQAALLEAMQEHRVTAAGETFQLDLPFFVLATQNPMEQEGTYPLPEAQLDRFMFSILIDYPSEEDEETIAKVTTKSEQVSLNKILNGEEILALQKVVRDLPVSDHVVKYAVRLVRSTRPADKRAPDFIKKWIHCGAGPRASQYLITGAKARAVIEGRLLVSTDDVRRVAAPILRHRIFTNFTADSEGMDTDKIVKKLIESVPEPDERDY